VTEIKVRANGPLLVTGDNVTVVDRNGTPYATAGPTIVLCRCGASANKPFCDGAHNEAGFSADATAPE
jgi:CDGSH-type Zn-finger protein